jgi:hypothetical protein
MNNFCKFKEAYPEFKKCIVLISLIRSYSSDSKSPLFILRNESYRKELAQYSSNQSVVVGHTIASCTRTSTCLPACKLLNTVCILADASLSLPSAFQFQVVRQSGLENG